MCSPGQVGSLTAIDAQAFLVATAVGATLHLAEECLAAWFPRQIIHQTRPYNHAICAVVGALVLMVADHLRYKVPSGRICLVGMAIGSDIPALSVGAVSQRCTALGPYGGVTIGHMVHACMVYVWGAWFAKICAVSAE